MTNYLDPKIWEYTAHNFWLMGRDRIGCTCGEDALLVSDIPFYRVGDPEWVKPYSGRGRMRYRSFRGFVEFDVRCLRCGRHSDISVLNYGIEPKVSGRKMMVFPEAQYIMEVHGCTHESDWLMSPRLEPLTPRYMERYLDWMPDDPDKSNRHLVICTHRGCRKRAFVWLADNETFPIFD